jgi:hypothetical protein
VLRRIAAFASSLPPLVRIGVSLVVAGLVVDVAYHTAVARPSVAAPCCGPGFVGHVLTLAGMLVSIAGAVVTGVRLRSRLRQPQERRS